MNVSVPRISCRHSKKFRCQMVAICRPAPQLLIVALLIVIFQQVLAQVAVEIAPDAVDVVGVVLGVVVLDQERRALNRGSSAGRPCSGRRPRRSRCSYPTFSIWSSRAAATLLRHVVGVLAEQRHQLIELLRHSAWTRRIPEGCPWMAALRLFIVIISPGAFSAKIAVFFCSASSDVMRSRPRSSSAERTRKPVRGPSRTSAGLAPKKLGPSTTFPFDDREVLADVVALHAISPSGVIPGRAENREVVFLRIAPLAVVLLHQAQHVFQAHDRDRLHVARLAETGAQQRAGEVLLIRTTFRAAASPCARWARRTSSSARHRRT